MKPKNLVNTITIAALILISSLTLFKLTTLEMIPSKFLIPIYIGMILVVLLLGYLSIKSQKAYISIINIILTLALVFTVINVDKLSEFIDQVTGSKTETHTIHVIVKKDSDFATFVDVKDEVFSANTNLDLYNIEKARELIKAEETHDIHIKRYEDYTHLMDDFYNDKSPILLISASHISLLDEIVEDFEEDTKIIASYSYTVELEETLDPNVSKETFSIYITGIDTSGPISSRSRSDVNMIMTLNPNKKQILLTSIPRDMHVVLHTSSQKDKLSHAGVYGSLETVKTAEDFLGVDIDYFLRVNFSSVERIVDALGGVEVQSQFNFSSGDYYFNKGSNYLNGRQALRFVRIRKALQGGDDDRVKNQQALLTGILNKAMSPSIITKYASFLESISDSFQTNIPGHQVNTLVKNQIDSMATWDIKNYQLEGTVAKSYTTYTHPGVMRVVKEPNMSTVEKAKTLILLMEDNVEITDEHIHD